jgi:hypothetical protein
MHIANKNSYSYFKMLSKSWLLLAVALVLLAFSGLAYLFADRYSLPCPSMFEAKYQRYCISVIVTKNDAGILTLRFPSEPNVPVLTNPASSVVVPAGDVSVGFANLSISPSNGFPTQWWSPLGGRAIWGVLRGTGTYIQLADRTLDTYSADMPLTSEMWRSIERDMLVHGVWVTLTPDSNGRVMATAYSLPGAIREIADFVLVGSTLCIGILIVLAFRDTHQLNLRLRDNKCIRCGYVLGGIIVQRCPECGCIIT